MTVDKIINWSELSKFLSNNKSKQVIRSNKVPKKYKNQVETLKKYVKAFVEGEDLVSKKELMADFNKNFTQISQNIQTYVENSLFDLREK